MTPKKIWHFAWLLVLAACAHTAIAAAPVKLVTGPETGTYIQFGHNIAEVATKYEQPVQVLKSHGSIDNIKRIVDGKGDIALGIVQSDILGFIKRSSNPNTQKVADRLSLVFPFYEEEVHILANKSINGLRDLQGKRVVVGKQGSGNMLTAINIMALSQISAGELLHLTPAEGVVAVISGEADAMIFVGGKPVPLFTNLAALKDDKDKEKAKLLEQVHFVPIDDQRVYAEYLPTRIEPGDYPFVDKTILTAKVTAVLVSYDNAKKQNPDGKHCKALQDVSKAIQQNIDGLRESGHPKWQEVSLYRDVTLWERNPCVWDGKRFIPGDRPKYKEALTKDLLDIVKHGKK